MQEVSGCVELYVTILDFSDDESDGSDRKANEEPEEYGKFLHLKERVGTKIHCIYMHAVFISNNIISDLV